MSLHVKSWQGGDLSIKVYTSTSGDAIQYGTRTQYPFEAGGPDGIPLGWLPKFYVATDFSKVNVTTQYGRFSLSAKDPNDFPTNWNWGIKKTFPTKPGYRYQIEIQAQTMEGKAVGTRFINVVAYDVNGNSNGSVFASRTPSQTSWEQIANGTDFLSGATAYIEVSLSMGWDTSVNTPPKDGNVGVQWQSLSINEQPPTPPQPTWNEVTCDVQSIGIRYGREKFTNRYEVGSFSVSVLNTDGEFSYQDYPPNNLRPGRYIKGVMLYKTTQEWPLFYGIIDSLQDGYRMDGHAVTIIQALDPSTLLSNIQVPTVSYRVDSTYTAGSWRINALLRAAGWFSDRQYAASSDPFIQQAIIANGRSVRDECGLIADSEGGLFYADPRGWMMYYGRGYTNTLRTKVQAELLAMPYDGEPLEPVDSIPDGTKKLVICVNGLSTSWSRDRIINDLQLANQGGSAFSFEDMASQSAYGPYTYQRLDFVNDRNHPEYLTKRADDIMTGYTDPVLRVNQVSFKLTDKEWPWLRDVFLDHLVRVRYQNLKEGWGYAVVTHIQGFEHRITPDDWEMSVTLDQPESFRWWDRETKYGNGWDQGMWDQNIWDESAYGSNWSTGYNWSEPNSQWGV